MATMTTNTHTIDINGMSGETCVQKVKTALDGVDGVTTDSVRVGKAMIHCDTSTQCAAACSAINAAGYKAKEAQGSAGASTSNQPGDKPGSASGSPQSKGGNEMMSEGGGGSKNAGSGTNKPEQQAGNANAKQGTAGYTGAQNKPSNG